MTKIPCPLEHGMQAEMHRFINSLGQHLKTQDKTLLAAADMFAVADAIDLQVENIHNMIDEMNEAGNQKSEPAFARRHLSCS